MASLAFILLNFREYKMPQPDLWYVYLGFVILLQCYVTYIGYQLDIVFILRYCY